MSVFGPISLQVLALSGGGVVLAGTSLLASWGQLNMADYRVQPGSDQTTRGLEELSRL